MNDHPHHERLVRLARNMLTAPWTVYVLHNGQVIEVGPDQTPISLDERFNASGGQPIRMLFQHPSCPYGNNTRLLLECDGEGSPWSFKLANGIDKGDGFEHAGQALLAGLRAIYPQDEPPINPVDPLRMLRRRLAPSYETEEEALVAADQFRETSHRPAEVVPARNGLGFHVLPLMKVGDRVSYTINGDTYPEGVVLHVSRGKVWETVTTSEDTKFRRALEPTRPTSKYNRHAWRKMGSVGNLSLGHELKLDPSF